MKTFLLFILFFVLNLGYNLMMDIFMGRSISRSLQYMTNYYLLFSPVEYVILAVLSLIVLLQWVKR